MKNIVLTILMAFAIPSFGTAAPGGLYSSQDCEKALTRILVDDEARVYLKNDKCIQVALVAVLDALYSRPDFDRPTRLTEANRFNTAKGVYVLLKLESPVTHHWLVPIDPSNLPNECRAGHPSLDIHDDRLGGGGVSVHN